MTEDDIASPARARDLAYESLAAIAFDSAPFGVSITSALARSYGRYVLTNAAYRAIVGYDVQALGDMTFQDVVHVDDLPVVIESLERLIGGVTTALDVELRLRRRDGSSVWVRQRRTLVRDELGNPILILNHTEDISERKSTAAAVAIARQVAETAMRESEARFRLIAEHAADMIVRTRADRTRAYVSPASKSLLGFEPHEIIELDFATFLHPDDLVSVTEKYLRFLEGGVVETNTYRLRHRDGHYVWVESRWVAERSTPLDPRGAPGCAVIAVVRDVSERKAAEAQIALMACHDSLSGLANRVLFHDRLEEALRVVRRGGSAVVLSIDLDDFKGVNDTYGHAVGDALVRAVAARLKTCVRGTDTVARLGGDEFAVVMLDTLGAAAAASARRIVETLGAPYEIDGRRLVITASVGTTIAPDDGVDQERLLKNADLALYHAKAEGRNTFRAFDPEMEHRVRARRTLEAEFREARVDEAFVVYYQPIVDLATDSVAAFEALVRWQHPERGLIAPGEFIAIAEETGLIVVLGEWVLREACREAMSWPENVRISVNLSPIQFKFGSLVDTVHRALRDSGLAAHRLDLEITESVLLQEDENTLEALHDLRAMGVGISLDDFGTGYSSLRYICTFPFDRLKIDRSFVAEMIDSRESGAIVSAVVELGKSLGIATIAEGVETLEHLEHLRASGCTEAQGYYFSKPRPAHEIQRFLEAFARARPYGSKNGTLSRACHSSPRMR